ncbi:MAG: M20/M25/M40 family metallo-hydrolase [Flavobacteriales bacterium]|nr:M20/M25/M40 family metallo-hydrolase [Flavobacteriales bacterium]
MRFGLLSLLLVSWAFVQAADNDSIVARKFFSEELLNGKSYEMLDELCNKVGHRLSGSEGAAKAVEWGKKIMEQYKFDRVFLQEVMVPHWVRGEKEVGNIRRASGAKQIKVELCALGGSVGTGKDGIVAEVVEVKSLEELSALGKSNIEGKIVFYNRPLDPTLISTGHAYGGAVDQRRSGASEAAKYGAVGVIVRSMTTKLDDVPHTGALKYDSAVVMIPAAAISTIAANTLSKLLIEEQGVTFYFKMSCETLPDVLSYNVVGEIKGSEKPDEIIVVGGHLDSWDLGQGAHDDGTGCVQAIEAVRLFRALGITPKRTIRAVLFMNEENGIRGGKMYAKLAKDNKENHIAAIESDAGGFTPRGFGIKGDEKQVATIVAWKHIFEDYNMGQLGKGWGGADIGPLIDQGTVLMGFRPDTQRYFDIHHTREDTFEKVHKRELELGAAGMGVMLYLLSEYGL